MTAIPQIFWKEIKRLSGFNTNPRIKILNQEGFFEEHQRKVFKITEENSDFDKDNEEKILLQQLLPYLVANLDRFEEGENFLSFNNFCKDSKQPAPGNLSLKKFNFNNASDIYLRLGKSLQHAMSSRLLIKSGIKIPGEQN